MNHGNAFSLVLVLVFASACFAAATTPTAQVALTQLDSEDCYFIHASFETASSPAEVWRVLSDYEGLHGILSSLKASKVLERAGDTALLEQVMVGKFLLFSRSIDLRLRVKEQAPWRIDFSSPDGGPFKHYEGSWQIDRTPAGSRVDYTLVVSRGDMAPRFLEERLFKDNSLKLMRELSGEVERRAVAAKAAGEPGQGALPVPAVALAKAGEPVP